MNAKRAVENGIFFLWIFFDQFAENSSSFFSALTFLAAGFCSPVALRFPILVPFYFGTNEAAATPTQVLALQGTFSSRLPGWTTPVLLPQTRLPQGQETRAHAGLAGQAGEPKLFPGRPERPASPRLAEGASGLLEKHRSLPAPYLTRRLLGASSCGSRSCENRSRPYLTRPLFDASASVCGAYLHVRRQYLTRRHRHQHPATGKQGTRHSGHGARHEP